jgi:hypothetical protein
MGVHRIWIDLDTSDPAIARLERHSYVNLINVIHAELQLVERMIDKPGSLRDTVLLSEAASWGFTDVEVARKHLPELIRFGDIVERDLGAALATASTSATESDVDEARSILSDVLPDAHLRVQEMIARHRLERPPRAVDVRSLAAALASHGVEFRFTGSADTISLRDGVQTAIVAMAAGDDSTHIRQIEVTQPGSAQLRVSVRGTGLTSRFDPLLRHLRPTELHDIIASGEEVLRGPMLLSYCMIPDGDVQLSVDGGPDPGSFAVLGTLRQVGTTRV